MAKKQSKFLLQQKIGLGLFALTLTGIVSYLGIKTFEDAPLGEFVEGEHYQLLENPRRVRGDKVEVMEFFSYGCVHCFNFEPMLADWVESKGSDINFVRTPAIANDYWRILGRAYFTLDQMEILEDKHMAMFRAIHQSRSDLSTPEALIDFIEEHGVERDKFESTYHSTQVDSSINRADQMARRLKVATVPTIVIQGKYQIRATRSIGQIRMLDVMDYLVGLEQQPQKIN